MGRKIAITGICSTLAQSVLPVLIGSDERFEICGIDIVEYAGVYANQIEMIQADVRDASALMTAFEGVDVVIHLAFIVIANIPKNFDEIYDININGSKNVFECAAKANVKQVIYFSSVAAYGMSPRTPHVIDESTPLEGHLMKKEFYYAYCKGMVENFLDTFEKDHPLLIITRFRPHIIAGPHFVKNTNNLTRMIAKLESKRKWVYLIQPLKASQHIMQLTHEEDLAYLTLFAIQSQLPGSYNLAGEPLDFGTFLQDRGKNVKFIPHTIVSRIVSFLSLISHKYVVLAQWLNGSKYQVIMNCDAYDNLNISYKLKTTRMILEEVVKL